MGVLLVLGFLGCYDARSSGLDEKGDEPAGVAGSGGAPSGPVPPEPPPEPARDSGTTPVPPRSPVADDEVLLNSEQAACLGVDQPVCAACHGVHGGGLIVLRPKIAPPHPPGVDDADRRLLMRCGLGD